MSRLSRFLGRANSDEQSVAPGAESSATGATAAEDGPVDTKMFGLHDARLSGWFLVETNELYRGMPIAPDDVVVDVGCGEGGNLSFCAQLGASVIGIDLDEASIETARARIAETSARASEFHVAPAEHLPVADGAATRVMCTEVLEHVDDPAVVLTELVRIGAPGAIYLITVPDENQERMQSYVAHEDYFKFPNHIRIVGREEFAEWVQAAGLEIVSQAGYGFFWSVWWALVWGCGADASIQKPWLEEIEHPALQHWTEAWAELLKTPEGRKVKEGLDKFMPKSQVIIARKPA